MADAFDARAALRESFRRLAAAARSGKEDVTVRRRDVEALLAFCAARRGAPAVQPPSLHPEQR